MKRWLGLVCCCVAAALVVTGCGGASKGKALTGTIRFSTWGSIDEKKVNDAIIEAFQKDHPGAHVDLEYIPDSYTQKIETEMVGGTAPDVLYGHPHYFANWASKDMILNLDDRFEKDKKFFYGDDFQTALYDHFMWHGHHVATINGSDTFLLFYNKDLFDKAGVAYPTDAWTWDDFIAAGKKLTITNGKNKQYGITFSNFPPFYNPFVYSFGGTLFDDMDHPTKAIFDSPETVAALQFLQDCVYKHGIAPTYQGSQTLGGSFDTGKVAMDVVGMWALVFRRNITDFKWDVANLPMRAGHPRKTAALYAGYAIYKNTKNPDLAWEFAKYMQSETGQKLLAGLGLITVINKRIESSDEVLKAPGMPEHAGLRISSVDYASNGYGFLTNWDELVAKGLGPTYDQLMANEMTPADAAKQIQKNLEQYLAESAK